MTTRRYEHCVSVDLGAGAQAMIPYGELEWKLRYGNVEDVQFVAASVIATFDHLIHSCTQREQVRRPSLMKKARQEAVNDTV